MSRICLALCFFALGYGFASVEGSQTSKTSIPVDHRPIISGSISKGATIPVFIKGAVPVVPNILKTPVFTGFQATSGTQALDSLDCRDCFFDNATLTYGGGAFNLVGLKMTGTTTVKLTGAAANTYAFLKFMDRIGKGVEGVSFPRNRAIEQKTITKKPMTKMTVTAPFIGPGQ